MTKAEAYQQAKPYFAWRLLELNGVENDILIGSPEDNKRLILRGYIAQMWLLYRMSC
jgi:hypothetical protein